jgi:hypothetical protein
MAIVDSKQKQLGLMEIIQEAIDVSGELNKYPPAAVYAGILAELNMPKTVVRQTGNTLWVIHKGEFMGNSFMNLFRMIAKNPVREGMGYQVLKMRSGDTGVLLKLGPERD